MHTFNDKRSYCVGKGRQEVMLLIELGRL
jgi:hypothetical protein